MRDLIEELQRFPPDDVVEFEVGRVTNHKFDDGCGRQTKREYIASGEFDRADEVGSAVKIQLV